MVYASRVAVEVNIAQTHREAARSPRGPVVVGGAGGVVAIALCLAATAGCGAQESRLTSPGLSEVRQEEERKPPAEASATAPWARAADVSTFRPVTPTPFVSHGHFDGRWTAELVASPEAASPYVDLRKTSAFPLRSVLLEKLRDRRTLAPGPWFAMEKRERGYYEAGGDWSYVVLDARGNLEQAGQIDACARCHAQGISDWVFGLPGDAPR
jgi:hypothetical protein